ncbi:MAG: permease [Spirochaetales bacterium]|nr:permease [Spirochaetales bacterium]
MINDFLTIFLAVVWETLPFLLIGSLIASLVHNFVDEETIRRVMPNNPLLQTLMALFIGLIFPLCECAIIPVIRGLIRKGVPLRAAITMMLAVPLINPISIAATFMAFPEMPYVVVLRLCLGAAIAIFTGSVCSLLFTKDILKEEPAPSPCSCCHGREPHDHDHDHDHEKGPLLKEVIVHTKNEFFDVGRFIVMGAAVSALLQVVLPAEGGLTGELWSSTLLMQTLGYLLSICSHADAFVAASFLGRFSLIPVLAFLIISPLIDIKNTIVLAGNFKPKFTATLVLLVFVLVYLILMLGGVVYGN